MTCWQAKYLVLVLLVVQVSINFNKSTHRSSWHWESPFGFAFSEHMSCSPHAIFTHPPRHHVFRIYRCLLWRGNEVDYMSTYTYIRVSWNVIITIVVSSTQSQLVLKRFTTDITVRRKTGVESTVSLVLQKEKMMILETRKKMTTSNKPLKLMMRMQQRFLGI